MTDTITDKDIVTEAVTSFAVKKPTARFRWVKNLDTGEKVLEQQIQVERHSMCGGSIELVWEPIEDMSEEVFIVDGIHKGQGY